MRFESLTVREVRQETPDCVSIAFEIPEDLSRTFSFTQGQNVTVRTTIDGAEVRRSYSICTAPEEGELRIAIKLAPQGLFSTFANQYLKAGDRLDVLPPSGRFFTPLDPAHRKQYLAFAAGSGITPLLSIIKTTLLREPGSQFTLVFGNRGKSHIIFREALEGLKNKYMDRFRVIHILSRERMDIPLFQGRIDVEKCGRLADKLLDLAHTDEYFICGPEAMIFEVKGFLESRDIPSSRIHFELFTTPGQRNAGPLIAEAATASGLTSKVNVKVDGLSFSFDLPYEGVSILDAALAEGADLPFACKGGVCSTCRARLIEGTVDMDANYALEADEVAAGYILTCQSHPRTPGVSVDYDAR